MYKELSPTDEKLTMKWAKGLNKAVQRKGINTQKSIMLYIIEKHKLR